MGIGYGRGSQPQGPTGVDLIEFLESYDTLSKLTHSNAEELRAVITELGDDRLIATLHAIENIRERADKGIIQWPKYWNLEDLDLLLKQHGDAMREISWKLRYISSLKRGPFSH